MGLVVGVFVVVINFLTLIPALRLVCGMMKQRCCAADEAAVPLLGGTNSQHHIGAPEPRPQLHGAE